LQLFQAHVALGEAGPPLVAEIGERPREQS
jgi:hypothetical protein